MKLLFSLPILLLSLAGFVMPNKSQEYHPSRAEQLVNSTLARTAKIIQEKYKIKPCGSGAAMPGGPIQELVLCFDIKGPFTKEELRKLLLQCAQELCDQVTTNEEMQQFLAKPPFTIKDVQIIIYNNDKTGREVYDPEISTAGLARGVLTYRTMEKSDIFKLKNEYEERYEEAVQAVQNEAL